MPLIGIRSNRSRPDLRRRSTLDPSELFQNARGARSAASLDVSDLRSHPASRADAPDDSTASGKRMSAFVEPPLESPPIQESTPNTRRFSMFRSRHASDSQLSLRAREQQRAERATEQAPPVPTIPADVNIDTPSIVMTAPSPSSTMPPPQAQPQKKQKLRILPLSKSAASKPPADSEDRKSSMDDRSRRRFFGSVKGSKGGDDRVEPGVLQDDGDASSIVHDVDRTHLAPPTNGPADDGSNAKPRPRKGAATRSTKAAANRMSRVFLPNRSKSRSRMVAVPVTIEPPSDRDTNAASPSPRPSTSAQSYISSNGSPDSAQLDHCDPNRSATALHHDGDDHLHLPNSPAALAASSIIYASPGAFLRNDSVSAQSAKSSPTLIPPHFHRLRQRSHTMGSTRGPSEDGLPPTPPFAHGSASGRTSMSTVGRNSFTNLFGLNQRFRHGSEPHSPAHGLRGSEASTGFASHANSFSISRETLHLPDREEGESAVKYLERAEQVIDFRHIASIVSRKSDDFSLAVMRSFMRKFAFFGEPLDMSIRKLLMEVDLPKETQQIDRVLLGFADRYHECNPGVFVSAEKAYFLSFSILILQTDAFNKNNKRKMTRADYLKNSSIDGVSEDVLGCFYDNIVYTPFIRVEDDEDIKQIHSKRKKLAAKNAITDPIKRTGNHPIDPYTLILENRLDAIRPPVKEVLSLDDPYTYSQNFDPRKHLKASKTGVIQIESVRSRPDAFMSPSTIENPYDAQVGVVDLPVDKVGVLWRKDAKKKTARSPWQEWGAILTGSGLCFFRNVSWVKGLMNQYDAHIRQGNAGTPVTFRPRLQSFKPDYLLSTEQAVALIDTTYKKHKHGFVVVQQNTAEETFLAESENDLNDWLAKLNHHAAFKTAKIRQKGLIGGHYEGQRQRALRRLDSSTNAHSVQTATGEVTISSGKIDHNLALQISLARQADMQKKVAEAEEQLDTAIKRIEDQLRDGRNLMVLAPIQQKTRDQLIHAAGRIAAQLKWTRYEMWRLKCHRDIMAAALEEERKISTEAQARLDRSAGQPGSLSSLAPPMPNHPLPAAATGSNPDVDGTHPSKEPQPTDQTTITSPTISTTTDPEEDFRTPPENTPQPSPLLPRLPFEPLTISTPANRRGSMASGSGSSHHDSPFLNPDSPRFSTYLTPTLGDQEAEQLREAGITSAAVHDASSESEVDFGSIAGSSPTAKPRKRRSLHRSLREGRDILPGHRHRRNKESVSSVDGAAAGESESLTRAPGSFTVHGKKASVITFGAEWAGMSAEERLRARKQAAASAPPTGAGGGEAAASDERGGSRGKGRADSIASEGSRTTMQETIRERRMRKRSASRLGDSPAGSDVQGTAAAAAAVAGEPRTEEQVVEEGGTGDAERVDRGLAALQRPVEA